MNAFQVRKKKIEFKIKTKNFKHAAQRFSHLILIKGI